MSREKCFLVVDEQNDQFVFTINDPQNDGYSGKVIEVENVEFSFSSTELFDDQMADQISNGCHCGCCLGKSLESPNRYAFFDSKEDCWEADFEPIFKGFTCVRSWADYRPPTAVAC